MKIGAGFYNFNENGTSISTSFDDEFKAIYPEFKELKMILKEIPEDKRTKENSPNFTIEIYKPKT